MAMDVMINLVAGHSVEAFLRLYFVKHSSPRRLDNRAPGSGSVLLWRHERVLPAHTEAF